MRQLLHTLYVTDSGTKLFLEGEALQARPLSGQVVHIPLHLLESIVSFSSIPATPALMAACAHHGIGMYFLSKSGKLRFRVVGGTAGNVLLRQQQYRAADDEHASLQLARSALLGKVKNSIRLLQQFRRNHNTPETEPLSSAAIQLIHIADQMLSAADGAVLRGYEGIAAKYYFEVFDRMILSGQPALHFHRRSRQPPLDCCNAMLSFAYTLLSTDCIQALECAGLDPYVGFLHGIRPGKPSLALDLMEEFRPGIADRFVLRLINLRIVNLDMFEPADGGIHLTEDGRRVFLREWSRMKQRTVTISNLEKPVPLGLLPHLRAKYLSRYLRGEDSSVQSLTWR